MKIKFLGAARLVTGSKHHITIENGKTILLDCGFFQGSGQESDKMNRHLGFDPVNLDYMVLSHAHIDHSGDIPFLVKQGYKGPIYCTSATLDLCKIMLKDSAHIQESDLKHVNERRVKRGEPVILPIYTVADVDEALKQFISLDYDKDYPIDKEISLRFTDAGHILGSAAVHLTIQEKGQERKLCFTGDIGRYNSSILRDPQVFPQCEILISESTYGDRLHTDNAMGLQELFEVIRYTCVEKQGKLVIPAFSLGRTQELVFALDQLETAGKLPQIDVFVDSPLSTSATNVMRAHPECFNENIRDYINKDPDPFGFEKLTYVHDVEESKRLNSRKQPCIIISASGMVEAGRIKHHVANSIGDPKNTILIVGYAEPTSIGGRIRSGEKIIKIFGEEHRVLADVKIMDSYSAHGDYKEMIRYLSCQDKGKVKRVFLVHGDYEAQLAFKDRLLDEGFRNITIPALGDEIEA